MAASVVVSSDDDEDGATDAPKRVAHRTPTDGAPGSTTASSVLVAHAVRSVQGLLDVRKQRLRAQQEGHDKYAKASKEATRY